MTEKESKVQWKPDKPDISAIGDLWPLSSLVPSPSSWVAAAYRTSGSLLSGRRGRRFQNQIVMTTTMNTMTAADGMAMIATNFPLLEPNCRVPPPFPSELETVFKSTLVFAGFGFCSLGK